MEKLKVQLALSERFSSWQRYSLATLACVGTALAATPLLGVLDLANIVMVFLLLVLLVAVTLGRGAAVLASLLSVLLFDYFFVPPRFSFAVESAQYLVTFFVMLVTALLTGQLAAGLKRRAREAQEREFRTQGLYELAARLAGALSSEQVVVHATEFVRDKLGGDCLVVGLDGKVLVPLPEDSSLRAEPHLVATVLGSNERVFAPEISENGFASRYLPLRASMRVRGVLAVQVEDAADDLKRGEVERLLDALASLVAIAIERLHYVEVAQKTQLEMSAERLRSSILSALSHDLRTPLTVLVGLADSLSLVRPSLVGQALDTAQAISDQAARMANLVGNLLDMAKLNSGTITLRKEWQPLEEVVGASIKLLGSALRSHPVRVHLPSTLPLLEFDAILLERVFCNLIENAAKYSPEMMPITISATERNNHVFVEVVDGGPGFPPGKEAESFEMFVRGASESSTPGAGLGLAICRTIIEAHDGHIYAENRDGGGCVCFSLPKGSPPLVEVEQ